MSLLKKYISAIIAFVLVIALLVTSEPFRIVSTVAAEDIRLSKLYLKEVKMFYADTPDGARAACESEGYIFCPTNLNEGAPQMKVMARDEKGKLKLNQYNESYTVTTDAVGIYLGYKTTENPNNAITDLTLLDMKYTHYEEIDYEQFLDEHVEDFRNEAAQMMALVRELDMKYRAGSPNAIMAYDLLNLFYVDEGKSHDDVNNQLGHYLINETDITFFEKFIQRGNATILNKIIDLLCIAASDYNEDGTTWVDRTKTSEVLSEYQTGTSETKNMYDSDCQDIAKKLAKDIKNFRETYTEAKYRLDTYGETLGYSELEGVTVENADEKFMEAGSDCLFPEYSQALTIYSLLESVTYQKKGEIIINNADLLYADVEEDEDANGTDSDEEDWGDEDWGDEDWGDEDWGDEDWGDDWGDEDGGAEEGSSVPEKTVATYDRDLTLAEYIMNLAADETLEDHLTSLYPLVSALSPAQRAEFSLGGFAPLVKGLFQASDYIGKRENAINEAKQKLKDCGYSDGRLYIWTGLDTSIYSKKVVQTDATKEAAAAGITLETSEHNAEAKESSDLNQALIVIDICTLGIGGLVMIVGAGVGTSLWSLGMSFIAKAGTYLITQMASFFASYALGAFLCALQVLNVLAIAVGIVMLLYSVLQWCGVFDSPELIDYSTIPDVVLDARMNEDGA
ncbi:MAG: hypothetical protein IKX49_01320, partial [Clostridia bacterium]|nr:hypothetical protein [Clostridia bacterium]